MQKRNSYWFELFFFGFTLLIGVWSHWDKHTYLGWGTNIYYLDRFGKPMIPASILSNPCITYFIFWLGTLFVYLLGKEIFNNRKWAMLAVGVFYFTPLLVGASFFDVVNGPLITWLVMGFFVLVYFVKKPTYVWAVVLALVHSISIWTHPITLVIPVVTVLFFILNLLTRNVSIKDIWKTITYGVILIVLLILVRYGLNYSPFIPNKFFLPSWTLHWYDKLGWVLVILPPLWIVYFLFSLIALNVVYFSNYFVFLKTKWIYSYLFVLIVAFIIAPWFLPKNILLLQDRYFFLLPSILLLGVAGCYEFSMWVRKKWGERVYFIFKFTFLPVFALQCVWSIIAMAWLHPDYIYYTNWPLFWMK